MDDDFLNRAEDLLQKKMHERDALEAQVRGVQDRLARVAHEVADLQRAIVTYRSVMEAAAPSGSEPQGEAGRPQPSSTSRGDVAPLRGTLAMVSAQIMERHGGRIKVADLVDKLREAGKLTQTEEDRDAYGTVFRTLRRNEGRFRHVAPGEFELVGGDSAGLGFGLIGDLPVRSKTSAR